MSILHPPYDLKNVEVSGEVVLVFLNYIDVNRPMRAGILAKHGIVSPQKGKWYPVRNFLDAMRELKAKTGANNLFLLGRKIVELAPFPVIRNLYEALDLLDVAYHINHRGGPIGHYLLRHYSPTSREATIQCTSPYDDSFDLGILTALVRKYKPYDSLKDEEVFIDTTKEIRDKGGLSTTYIIRW